MSMRSRPTGFSLIELLVVLAIVGILSAAGAFYFTQGRQDQSVRSVMDEVDGALRAAQENAKTTLGNVTLSTGGKWTTNPALFLDYVNTDGTGAGAFVSRFPAAGGGSSRRDHMEAGVMDAGDAGWLTTALGAVPTLNTVPPCNADPYKSALANNLFKGSADGSVNVNGYTQRYSTGFFVAVVGMKNGVTFSGAPVGILIMPNGGTTVMKFYKGTNETSWRRL